METKKVLKEQRDDAEGRAITYLKKLNKIESIIRVEQCEKTPSVFILDKIKEVIINK